MPLEQGTELGLPITTSSNPDGKRPLRSVDPESAFLDTLSASLYPSLKRRYPDVSLNQIRDTAEQFRGARIKSFLNILIPREVDRKYPTPQTPSALSILFEQAPTTPPAKPLSFLDRLKNPLHAIGTKLQSVEIPISRAREMIGNIRSVFRAVD